ncbi:hAT dimerisation domain-containing protein / transposase-related [Striga hermonthica]|uniref:HAT dimerisation domain-containing protein / transposase-related n=1 Tax=Striga hermonthica TaxID=68872 RepID=A0A9N7MMN8_STRHE|nr:hAT dimerisation domain-containing protein / transposase-related [Striga hermonthica]
MPDEFLCSGPFLPVSIVGGWGVGPRARLVHTPPPALTHAASTTGDQAELELRTPPGFVLRATSDWSQPPRMSPTASRPSVDQPETDRALALKRNSDDVGWEYGVLIDPNDLNVIKCKLCPKVVKAGIYRLKLHIAGKKGEVRACPNATEEDKAKCSKAIDESRRAKRARREKEQEVRHDVTIDIESDVEPEENTGLDEITGSGSRVMGPMENFTKPMDSNSLAKEKKLHQQKISEHVMKERLHRFKRYVARWLYVRSVTRFASNFLTLQSLYEKKEQLRTMSQSEEWEKISHVKSAKGVQATATLVRPNFWSSVSLCLRVFEPLVKVLRMVDGDVKPSMAFLYGEILKAKEDIKVAIGKIPGAAGLYSSILEIIDVKMENRLDCPLHKAAYFLNPYYSYNDDSIVESEEVMDGFLLAVETFYHGDYDKQAQVLNEEVHKFKDRAGHFGKQYFSYLTFSNFLFLFFAAKWWGNYGTQVPALQKMAIRILSLTSSASGCERNWSCHEGIHTKKRNKLTCERLEQLVFVQFNALHGQKRDKAQKNKKVDPLLATEATCAQGWIVEGGEEDEIIEVDPVTGLTWQLISETCGADEVTKLRRSARLNQPREIEEDIYSESEDDPIDVEEIEFESDQEDVVTAGYEAKKGTGTSDD